MGRKRKNLQDLNTANGKDWKSPAKSIYQLIGYREDNNPYSHLNKSEYEILINDMNTYDLHSHAAEVLVPIRDNRDTMIRDLLNNFESKEFQYKHGNVSAPPDQNIPKQLRDILAEGK